MILKDNKEISVSCDMQDVAGPKLFAILSGWCTKNDMYDEESLSQSDTTYEDAPIILGKLCRAMRFKVRYKEDE